MASQRSPAKAEILVAQICMEGTQSRAEISQATVCEYQANYRDKKKMPPVVLYYDGTTYWLGDGFHRVLAAVAENKKRITCEVRKGTKRDAILHSVGSNDAHGLRRTNADKRHAVMLILADEEWVKWPDRRIADHCNVSNHLVSEIRTEVCGKWENSQDEKPQEGESETTEGDQETEETDDSENQADDSQDDDRDDTKEDEESDKPATDRTGHELPESIKEEFLLARADFDSMLNLCKQLRKGVNAAMADPKIGVFLAGKGGKARVESDLDNVRNALRFAAPYAVCPYCKARGGICKACQGHGWVGESVFSNAPPEMKE